MLRVKVLTNSQKVSGDRGAWQLKEWKRCLIGGLADSDVLKKKAKETGRGQEAEMTMGTLPSYRCGGRIEAQRPN